MHSGQSGQPSPDSLSRTAAPVTMLPAVATTPPRAMTRIDAAEGQSTGAAIRASSRRSAEPRAGAGGAVFEVDVGGHVPIVGPRRVPPAA